MMDELAKNLVNLKQAFVSVYNGNSHIQEILPITRSESFPFDEKDLEMLHEFAKKNPIYYNSYEQTIGKIPCRVYEGDINEYWLNSISHGASYQPFYPTWIFSAYIIALAAKNLGFKEALDIGSGDGRIAYCAKMLDMNSYSFEIDNMLVELQHSISASSGIDFNPNCTDAMSFDYSSLHLKKPVFFIGGLAQMGGVSLATGVLDNFKSCFVFDGTGVVFAGTYSKKYTSDPMSEAGWGTLIHKYGLQVIDIVVLPTVWTFHESDDTPYIFSKFIS